MLREVQVANPRGDVLVMPLADPVESGIVVKEVTGIGPGDAYINTTAISTNDGTIFNSARLQERSIRLTLEFWPERYDIETIRHRIYAYFPLKGLVSLLFVTDSRSVVASGYVESNDVHVFSEREYADITVRCPDPYFYSADEEGDTSFSSVVSEFEFPFSNESLEDNLISFGEIVLDTDQYLEYRGDGDTGITITIDAIGTVEDLAVYNVDTRETMAIDTSKISNGFISGDRIVINTRRGHKSIRLLRNGKYTNILNALDRDAEWFQLSYGVNHFAYTASSGIDHLRFSISYRTLYEGV